MMGEKTEFAANETGRPKWFYIVILVVYLEVEKGKGVCHKALNDKGRAEFASSLNHDGGVSESP